jgi:two-component system nitrate/nitrite response regulator NarL
LPSGEGQIPWIRAPRIWSCEAVAGSRSRVTIIIADDHAIVREGLQMLLQAEPAFQVIGEAVDGAEAVQLVKTLEPDVLLLDVAMPRLGGLAALRELAAASVSVRSIMLAAAITQEDIVLALQLGARGVVLKETASKMLFACIRAVMAGQYWVGRDTVAGLVEALRSLSSSRSKRHQDFGLTPRQLEVVLHVVGGLSNKEIAQTLSLSEDTIKHHLTNIFDKTGVSNRLEVALFATHHGMVH